MADYTVLQQTDLLEATRELAQCQDDTAQALWAAEWGDDLIFTITTLERAKGRLERAIRFMTNAVQSSTGLITRLGQLISECPGGVLLVAQVNPIVQQLGGEIIGHSLCAEGATLFDDPADVQSYAERQLVEQGAAAAAQRPGGEVDLEAQRKALVDEIAKRKAALGGGRRKRKTGKNRRQQKNRPRPGAVPATQGNLLDFAAASIRAAGETENEVQREPEAEEGGAETGQEENETPGEAS